MIIEKLSAPENNFCPGCRRWMDLSPGNLAFESQGLAVELVDTYLLRCSSCSRDYLPHIIAGEMMKNIESAGKKGRSSLRLKIGIPPHREFNLCRDPEFIYDEADYFFIPTLWDSSNNGAFCPVFFEPGVLERFARHPGYFMDIQSSSFGLLGGSDTPGVPFGINSNGLVYMWLGDIDRLPPGEQYYLRSHNIPSDHRPDGALYRLRADMEEPPGSIVDKLLKVRSDMDNLCLKNLGKRLYRFPGIVEDLAYYLSRQVSWEGRHRGPKINLFDVLINQGLDMNFLNAQLNRENIATGIPARNPINTLFAWMEQVLQESQPARVVEPFVFLNDLRDLAMDLLPSHEIPEVSRRLNEYLGLKYDSQDTEEQFERLSEKIISSFDEITNSLKLFEADKKV